MREMGERKNRLSSILCARLLVVLLVLAYPVKKIVYAPKIQNPT
jgi:hypothetical protein